VKEERSSPSISSPDKTRSPGYVPGDHWVICDRCGKDVRSSVAMKTWDNLVVCPADWEPRHRQDFVRSKQEETSAKGLVRPEPTDVFISHTISAVVGIAIVGRAIVGMTDARSSEIPAGTFNNSL